MVYNYKVDLCGLMYIIIGDGGNWEGLVYMYVMLYYLFNIYFLFSLMVYVFFKKFVKWIE